MQHPTALMFSLVSSKLRIDSKFAVVLIAATNIQIIRNHWKIVFVMTINAS